MRQTVPFKTAAVSAERFSGMQVKRHFAVNAKKSAAAVFPTILLPAVSAWGKWNALQAKYIIHSVGPVWRGGVAGEEFLLRSCYRSALELAAKHKLSSIAFPLISSGIYGYPKEEALNIAVDEIGKFALLSDMEIFLVIYNAEDFVIDDALRKEVAAYIAEQKALPEETYPNIHFDFEVKEIDKPAISQPEKDFYRKANLSRADFMRISRPSVGKKISKDEVISMAIALEFDFEKTKAMNVLSRL